MAPSDKQNRFATTDMSEAKEYLDQAYGWRITVHRPNHTGNPLVVSQSRTDLVTMAHATAPGEPSYRVHGDDYVVLDTLYAGTFELAHGHTTERYGPGNAFVANHPGAEFTSRTHDIDVLTTTLPSSLFTEVAGADPERATGQVEFSSYAPIAGTEHRWHNVSRFVDNLLADPQTSTAPLVTGPAVRLLTATALETFPTNLTRQNQPHDRTDATPETLRRAVDFIDEHAHADIGLTDIAAAAGVTPRAIQYAFGRHRNTSPLEYLRQVRLAHAHNELQTTDPSTGATVTTIAARWGFAHPGRFATLYRRTYGRPPRGRPPRATLHT